MFCFYRMSCDIFCFLSCPHTPSVFCFIGFWCRNIWSVFIFPFEWNWYRQIFFFIDVIYITYIITQVLIGFPLKCNLLLWLNGIHSKFYSYFNERRFKKYLIISCEISNIHACTWIKRSSRRTMTNDVEN